MTMYRLDSLQYHEVQEDQTINDCKIDNKS